MKSDSFFLTYDDALEIVSEFLKEVPNIRKFCNDNNLEYYNTLKIKSQKGNPRYPLLMKKLLGIIYCEVETEPCFIIKKKSLLKK